ncbi:MAG: ATP-binding protein [Acidimicrobiales bacterium]
MTASAGDPSRPPARAAGAALFDLMPDAVVEVDAQRRIVAANRAAEHLTGYLLGQMRGADCAAMLNVRTRDGRAAWAGGWDRSTNLPGVRSLAENHFTLRRADGRDIRVLVTGTYLRSAGGGLSGALLVLRDPVRRNHHEPSGIEIVSTVSHELRSPLTTVKGYTSLLLNRWERISDDQKKLMLEQINHDADRVTRLITELLDISRLETGRLVLRRQAVDLAGLSAEVVGKVRLAYPDLDAALVFPPGLPEAWADSDKVEQVLTNLLENACKYASPLGLTIDGEAAGDAVAVRVTDRGAGIPPQDVPKVFTKFFRRSGGKPTGSGLGLWISRGLVEAHGGNLVASSLPGEGSSFRFTLPRADREPLLAN